MAAKDSRRGLLAMLRNHQSDLHQRLQAVSAFIESLEKAGDLPRKVGAASKGTRRLSKAGRESISRAATKRWAKYRKQKAAAK